jgi:AcrR family transcriptional regulator
VWWRAAITVGRKKIERSVELLQKIERSCYFLSMSLVTEPPAHTDGRRARGDNTRRAILGRAMQLASAEGLEDLSIARLAGDLGMSKSGLFAHFGSKEELQLSTVRAARRVFSDEAVTPALAAKKGIERLSALIAAWHDYIANDTFAGGCLLMEAAAEFDNRPGPVRDLIAETMGMWMGLLVEQAERALERGELALGTDPAQLAWELHAFGLALNWDSQLNGAAGTARQRAAAAVRARLEAAATAKGRRRLAKAAA